MNSGAGTSKLLGAGDLARVQGHREGIRDGARRRQEENRLFPQGEGTVVRPPAGNEEEKPFLRSASPATPTRPGRGRGCCLKVRPPGPVLLLIPSAKTMLPNSIPFGGAHPENVSV